jgi:hypothetical protein
MGSSKGTDQRLTGKARQRGFALPLAMGIGLVMISLAATATFVAQSDRKTSFIRRENGSSMLVTEGGIARALVQLRAPENSALLGRNYDPINPSTGRTYLGADGVLNSGDEETQGIDQWSNYSIGTPHPCVSSANSGASNLNLTGAPNLKLTGTIGGFPFTIKAYRYNSFEKTGSLLVQGTQGQSGSHVLVRFSVLAPEQDFPGVLVSQTVYLQGRSILGSAGNVYFNFDDNDGPESSNTPTLRGVSEPNSGSRPNFLNAIFSGAMDGSSGDPVAGKLAACDIAHTFAIDDQPSGTKTKNLKDIDVIVADSNPFNNSYLIDKVDFKNDDTLTVDTTRGVVSLYIKGALTLKNDARIRNVRSDGKPPRAADLRMIAFKDGKDSADRFALFNNACIENAFILNSTSDLQIQTTGNVCSNTQANVTGIVWVEDLLNSRIGSRLDPDKDKDIKTNPNNYRAGIAVPEDISGLDDLMMEMNWPLRYKFGEIKSWQRVRP